MSPKIIIIQHRSRERSIRLYFYNIFDPKKIIFHMNWRNDWKKGQIVMQKIAKHKSKMKRRPLSNSIMTSLWRHSDVINDELWKMSHWNSMSQCSLTIQHEIPLSMLLTLQIEAVVDCPHRPVRIDGRPSDVPCLTLNRHCVPLVKSETTVRIQDWPIRASQMHEMPLSSSALPLPESQSSFIYLKLIKEQNYNYLKWRHNNVIMTSSSVRELSIDWISSWNW